MQITISGIMATLVLGVFMLVRGMATKKKWLTIIAVVPLAIALSQIGIILLMFLEIVF